MYASIVQLLYRYTCKSIVPTRRTRDKLYFAVFASVVSCQFFGTAASLSFIDS